MTRRHYSLAAALMIGVAFFLMRIWASGGGDLLLAFSLTLVEVGAVLFLETQARRLEAEVESWRGREKEIAQADARIVAADQEVTRRRKLVDEALAASTRLEQEIEDDHLLSDLKSLTGIAKNAIRSGYLRGIAANAGEISGMSRLGVVA